MHLSKYMASVVENAAASLPASHSSEALRHYTEIFCPNTFFQKNISGKEDCL
jgi:hypothetical protein